MSKGELHHRSLNSNTSLFQHYALEMFCLQLLFVHNTFNDLQFLKLPAMLITVLEPRRISSAVSNIPPLMLRKEEFRTKSRPCSL